MHPGRGDQNIQPVEQGAQAFHGVSHFVQIAHVRPQLDGYTAGLLNLQLRQVQFGLAARQQPNPGPRFGEAHGQTLADAASRARDQNTLVFEGAAQGSVLHVGVEYPGNNLAGAVHLHVNAVRAGLRKSVGKRHLSG